MFFTLLSSDIKRLKRYIQNCKRQDNKHQKASCDRTLYNTKNLHTQYAQKEAQLNSATFKDIR